MTPHERRLQLLKAGYSPLPLFGKRPVFDNWPSRTNTNPDDIRIWAINWPDALNTGILTRLTPALDIDILDPEAAEAAERLACDRFEEDGLILPRLGKSPKRAILFRTDQPFAKLKVDLIAPNGSEGEKIEFLCDGQQVVVDGIHPETKAPYYWPKGTVGDIKREDLPHICAEEAQLLVNDIVELLCVEHRYRRKDKPRAKAKAGNGPDGTDWTGFIGNLIDHDYLVAFAMSLLRSGMDDGAAVNLLRASVAGLKDVDEARKQRRLIEIPGMVSSARAKLDKPEVPPPQPSTLDQVIATFNKWLMIRDTTPIYAVLGAVAANLLPGDPVWLGIIAPPSSAKTEILNALSRLPYIEPTATLTPAALLSGTPKRDVAPNAKGGLLRKIGKFGILVLKDFGSVLSMRPDAKAEVIAALREVYDGAWTRHLGIEGGKTLSWDGKLGLIFGATEAYDDHHAVISSLGDRFLLCRPTSSYGGQLRKALDHTGATTKTMRAELAEAVAGLFTAPPKDPPPLSGDEFQRLDDVVSLAVRLRAHVNRDRYSREIESIHGAEGPGRLGLCLERLLAGLDYLGLDRKEAMRIIEDIALASAPPLRRHPFELLSTEPRTTREIAQALKLPTITTRRVLEDLAAQGLAVRERAKDDDGGEKKGGADRWTVDAEWEDWRAKWQATVNV